MAKVPQYGFPPVLGANSGPDPEPALETQFGVDPQGWPSGSASYVGPDSDSNSDSNSDLNSDSDHEASGLLGTRLRGRARAQGTDTGTGTGTGTGADSGLAQGQAAAKMGQKARPRTEVGDVFLIPRGATGCVAWPWRLLGRAGLTQPHMVMLEMYAAALAVFLVGRLVGGDLALYHFTYWGLLLSFGLAVAWVAVGARDSLRRPGVAPWEGPVLAIAGPFVLGVLLLVAVLITAVPVMDPNIVKSQGGDTPLGIVNLFNLLMHYLPPVVFGTAMVARWSLVKQYLSGLHRAQVRAPTRAILQEAVILVLALLLPCTTANMYTSLFDFNSAYGVNIVHSRAYLVGYVTAGLYYLAARAFFLSGFNHGTPS